MNQSKIKLLPPDIASQIAAGEVIQRPASVVKELIENALDAGATEIVIHIKNAGKTAIIVEDNGIGMNAIEASLAFEKHATSKIHDIHDLYQIQTYGFRGEALPSIAAISRVELKTRDEKSEMGTSLFLEAGKIIEQKPCYRDRGTTIVVKDLFFNIPARKKFLKSDNTELAHIYEEIYRAAFPNTEVTFQLHINDKPVLTLPRQTLVQRILTIWGKTYQNRIVYFEEKTEHVTFRGYVVKPEHCKKTHGEQYFFVNNRYFRSPILHHALKKAYQTLIPLDIIPGYVIFFEVNPSDVDVNIHPTKTEVKFAHEQIIATFLTSTIKKAISSSHFIPSMDFEVDRALQFPVFPEKSAYSSSVEATFQAKSPTAQEEHTIVFPTQPQMDKLSSSSENDTLKPTTPPAEQLFMQWKRKFILTSIKPGLIIINQHRAHVRILFEQLLHTQKRRQLNSQQLLFPHHVELTEVDKIICQELLPELEQLGFVITTENNHYVISALPALQEIDEHSLPHLIQELIEQYKNAETIHLPFSQHTLPFILASKLAIKEGHVLSQQDMQNIVQQLFLTSDPQFTPDGKPIYRLLHENDIEQFF